MTTSSLQDNLAALQRLVAFAEGEHVDVSGAAVEDRGWADYRRLACAETGGRVDGETDQGAPDRSPPSCGTPRAAEPQ